MAAFAQTPDGSLMDSEKLMISDASHATPPLRVGIAGLGRSGWNIHARTLAALPDRYQVAAVMDPEPERCAEARAAHGCRVHPDFEALAADPDLDVIVVASPNHLHADHAVAALDAGKHVVCEKPFALTVDEADRVMAAAQRNERVLSPFQNRRYEPHFLKVRELIDSGVLGQVVHIRMSWHQFTRRWDWQTLRRFGGGLLNNNGSHLLDHALQLLPDDVQPEVFADLQRVLSLGDTEDHVKIVLTTPDHPDQPTIDVELSNASIFEQDRWLVLGTRGGLRGTTEKLTWRTVDWDALPERTLETAAATGRTYNHDPVTWKEHTWDVPSADPKAVRQDYVGFYGDLYRTIREDAPLVITPQSVRRLIATLARCGAYVPPVDPSCDPVVAKR